MFALAMNKTRHPSLTQKEQTSLKFQFSRNTLVVGSTTAVDQCTPPNEKGGQLIHLKKWHAEIVAKIAIPVGTGQLVRHFMRDFRLEKLNIRAGLLYTLNPNMAIRSTNTAATTAPKQHIVFNRAVD
jgi:hypothetical protein